MCFHASQTKKTTQLEDRFKVLRDDINSIEEDEFTFYHSNGFEHREIAIITQEASDVLEGAYWGIMPSNELGINKKEYYKKSVKWGAGLNAKSEKVLEHFIYSESIYEQRCIIPFDGFFEPHEFEGNKFPCYVHRKDNECFGLAGLYSITKDGHLTTTILTRPAENLMAKVHNNKLRQPVILNTTIENNWLDHDLNDNQIKELINTSYNQTELEAYFVSKDLYKKINTNKKNILIPKNNSLEFFQ